MCSSIAMEKQSLVFSAVAAGLFALAGIAWGLWVDSLVILFDGAYSLVSLLLSCLSLYAARLVRRPISADYPFGLGAAEPLVIALKGLVIAFVCVISLGSAVIALFQGGRSVDAGMAVGFGLVSVVGCFLVWAYLRWANARSGSGLVLAEQRQWLMDGVLSVAVVLGFAAAWLLERSQWAYLAVYADPVMMVVISVCFIKVPVQMAWGAVRELMLAAPSRESIERAGDSLEAAGLDLSRVKVAKLGPTLLLEARLVMIGDVNSQASSSVKGGI